MTYYVGVKIIDAEPQVKDGKDGYCVKYTDGYKSWSPKDVFENAYFQIGDDPTRASGNMVDAFIKKTSVLSLDDSKTTLVRADMITGFVQYHTSSCVDPKNYDVSIGKEICISNIRHKLWELLGFVMQWGVNGLNK
jgi:hypothetical protein